MNVDILIKDGVVVTMNDSFDVLRNGAIGIRSDEIVSVGPTQELQSELNADKVIDATDQLILPGLINTHVHVSDILSRGIGKQRILHDWVTNVKKPFVAAMDAEEHRIASKLYCYETILSGITTFVENAGATGNGYEDNIIESKLGVYEEAGIRNVYAHGFMTEEANEEMEWVLETFEQKEPEVNHPPTTLVTAEEGLSKTESLIETYHETADGRQSVWPAPFLARTVSPEALRGAYELAEEYEVMTTTHTAEAELQERYPLSSVEYLDSADYLGERTLLGHCVQVDDRDLQLLARTDTKVAHNLAANLSLASGIAPVTRMLDSNITVGIGTDNACLSDIVNMFADMRMVSLVHKGHTRNPSAITAKQVLSMATRDGAVAIGRGDDLGSVESGKKADLILLDLNKPHLVPTTNLYSTIIHQMQGKEIETVICNGETVMRSGEVESIEQPFSSLYDEATEAAKRITERAGLTSLQ